MNKEIHRKITSLTLMTIMVAGGLTFAIPGVTPDAEAASARTGNLLVSTTTFGGPMVVEIIVDDPDLAEIDQAENEPDVTFDGNEILMVQATDGKWYAYVAAGDAVDAVDTPDDGTNGTVGFGLDFGTECNADELLDTDLSSSSFDTGARIFADATGSAGSCVAADDTINVVRESKGPTQMTNGGVTTGQVGLAGGDDGNFWPFIQVFNDINDDNLLPVIYNTSPSQVVNVTYDADLDDFASYEFDRTSYPHGAQVFLTINDNQLNIDPTDEDTWTFNSTGTGQTFYYVFTEAGILDRGPTGIAADAVTDPRDYITDIDGLYGDTGFLLIDQSPNGDEIILEFQENNDHDHAGLDDAADDTAPLLTVQETAPNSGVFENFDSNHQSNLITTGDETLRDLNFELNYDDTVTSLGLLYTLGRVVLDASSIGESWNSGEPIAVTITDLDENKNSQVDDDFVLSDSQYDSIPSIVIGDPKTLASTITAHLDGTADENELELDSTIQTAVADVTATNMTVTAAELALMMDIETRTTGNGDFYTGNITVRNNAQEFLEGNQTALEDLPDNLRLQLNISDLELILRDANTAITSLEGGANQTLLDNLEAAESDFDRAEQNLEDLRASTNLDNIDPFSRILTIDPSTVSATYSADPILTLVTDVDTAFLDDLVDERGVYHFINYDVRSVDASLITLRGEDNPNAIVSITNPGGQGLVQYTSETSDLAWDGDLVVEITTGLPAPTDSNTYNIAVDIFTFGESDDGARYNDAVYRMEAEETGVNTGIYAGTIEYRMLNQINVLDADTFSSIVPISDELEIIVHEDLTDEDGVELIYLDADTEGIRTQVSDKEDAPTNSGVVSLDADNYKVADTVTVTLEDADLNTDYERVDTYRLITSSADPSGIAVDTVGFAGEARGLLLDITFNDGLWTSCDDLPESGFASSTVSLRETTADSGVFTTTFQIPEEYCQTVGSEVEVRSVTGTDIEVNYQDFRDSSGETIEVGDSAGIRANTGSVSLDRTVYPVPFGQPGGQSNSFFPLHATAIAAGEQDENVTIDELYLADGELSIHIRVNDPDYDVSATGRDSIADNIDRAGEESDDHGPVKVTVSRGSDHVVLTTAGGLRASTDGEITIGDTVQDDTNEFGPITEVTPDSGVFELDLDIAYTDGPASTRCPTSDSTAVDHIEGSATTHCILQGDILTVEYNDPTDASGDANTITDSATFDLRNGLLQADKNAYIIGSDMILTLIEPDFDLDNDGAETYDLDLIEWDSDASTTSMGSLGGDNALSFDPEPSNLRETGDSTGIFQIVIEVPESLDGDNLERGEQIILEYTDWGPSGADYVGEEDEDINLTVFTSNFGATVELDQKVYTWTDKVYITIVAPDHNFDGDLVDEIGETADDAISVTTRDADIDNYRLVETGADTGVFSGEVILTGFSHDADGDGTADAPTQPTSIDGTGPTDGFITVEDDEDGITVSFEFSDNETVIGSALIRWNVGETQWLEASYPASGTGVVRVVDPDLNLNPESVDNFNVEVISDSDAGGISLTVTETNEATGIFEGTVFFTVTDSSSGHRLRVAEGDTVTANYDDHTLPDPYTAADDLDIRGTTIIGTIVPPLERAPISNARVVDAFGNSLSSVSLDQQVQIQADLRNGQDRDQAFAYLVQIQDGNGVTVSLAWITGLLSNGQSFSPALSWTPDASGSYTATVFAWESVDNPSALSPPASVTIDVA